MQVSGPAQDMQDYLDKQAKARLAKASFRGGVKIGTGRFIAPKPKGPGTNPPKPATPSHSGGGGFLHALGSAWHATEHAGLSAGKWTQAKTDLAAHDIAAMPGGLYVAGKALGHDASKANFDLMHKLGLHPHMSGYDKRAAATPWETPTLAKAAGKQTLTSIEHPGRDPFNTGLTLAAVASLGAGTAARAGAAGEAFSAADEASALGRTGAAGKAFLRKPVMPNRIIDVPKEVGGKKLLRRAQFTASQRPLSRAVQSLHDKVVENQLNRAFESKRAPLANYANKRVGKAIDETARIADHANSTVPGALAKVKYDKGLPRHEGHLAVFAHASHVTPSELRDAFTQWAHETQDPVTEDQLLHLADTANTLHNKGVILPKAGGGVEVSPKFPKLGKVAENVRNNQALRESIIARRGQLSPEAMAERRALVAEMVKSEAARNESTGVREGGYVNLATSSKNAVRYPRSGAGRVIGKIQNLVPKSKHATGEGLMQGLIPYDVPKVVARSTHDALQWEQKHLVRGKLADYGSDVSKHPHDVLVAIPGSKIATEMPQDIKEYLGKEYSNLEPSLEGTSAQTIGKAAPKGYRWVPKGMAKSFLRSTAPRGKAARSMDALNSAITLGTVYAKVSHVPQRAVTDATTSLLSGALSSKSSHAFLRELHNHLSEDDWAKTAQVTGTHGYSALPHEGDTGMAHLASKGANVYAKYIDSYFRKLNLAHEARKMGIDTPQEFKKMLAFAANPEKRIRIADAQKYTQVLQRANRVSMMYDALTPGERATIGRAVWFYPWIKASARYGGHVVGEHPLVAAGVSNSGVMGRKMQKDLLGNLPDFAYGMVPYGKHQTMQPGWLTPANTMSQLMELPSHPTDASGNLNPTTQALWALATGQNSYGDVKGSRVGNALSALAGPLPEFSILNDMANPKGAASGRKIFPHTWENDIITRLLGGPSWPKPTNLKALHRMYRDQHRKIKYEIPVYQKKH